MIVPATLHWEPGETVRVAFSGGDPALYAKIEQAASRWTAPGVANLKLSFRDASGQYRLWSASDKKYAAEERIAFNRSGY